MATGVGDGEGNRTAWLQRPCDTGDGSGQGGGAIDRRVAGGGEGDGRNLERQGEGDGVGGSGAVVAIAGEVGHCGIAASVWGSHGAGIGSDISCHRWTGGGGAAISSGAA